MDSSEPLCEVSEIFKAYKAMIQKHRFQTPFQRAHSRLLELSAQMLSQKALSQAEHVNSLLPPGHFTRLNVDVYVRKWKRPVQLKVPVTLVGQGEELCVLYTGQKGMIQGKSCRDFETAVRDFQEALQPETFKPAFPKYILKRRGAPSTLHFSLDSACAAWLSASPESQRLQEFIQPHTKSATLVRVHWKSSCPNATYYFISQDSNAPLAKRRESSVLEQVAGLMKRSISEPKIREIAAGKATGSLRVHRVKRVPELEKIVKESLKLLQGCLAPGEVAVEAVFDYTCNQQHQWVFLACKGYSLSSPKARLKVATVEHKQEISLNYLFYPLVARRPSVQRVVSRSLNLSSISLKRRKAVITAMAQAVPLNRPPEDSKWHFSCPIDSSPDSSMDTLSPRPRLSFPSATPSLLVGREVEKYDSMVQGVRRYKASTSFMLDYVQKYGGVEFWQVHVSIMVREMLQNPHYGDYFENNVSVEECSFIKRCILRILRGNYNFYYKETICKLHARAKITETHFKAYMLGVEGLLEGLPISEVDREGVMRRFRDLQSYICSVK